MSYSALPLESDSSTEDIEDTDTESIKPKSRPKTERFYCTDFPPCNLSFTRSEHLARHTRKHTGERPFQCHCGRRFSRLDNLRLHAQTVHVNEDIPPDSLAATGTGFQRQVRTDNIRPKPQCWDHGCNGRQFTTFSNLLRHQREKSEAAVNVGSPHKKRRRTRMDLPLIINNTLAIDSLPDTGSEYNIISADLAQSLGLMVEKSHQMEFALADGKRVKSDGMVTISCSFEREPTFCLSCSFYVFRTLIMPLIMGMEFLNSTETLTKNKHRLKERALPGVGPFRVSSISTPRRLLRCFAANVPVLAKADTGSEVDLVSLEYVTRRGFVTQNLHFDEGEIQLADGSIVSLQSKLRISIILQTGGPSFEQTFYVLDGLTSDMLLGDEFLFETDAFDTYRESFGIYTDDEILSGVNTIIWLKGTERFFSRMSKSHKEVPKVSAAATPPSYQSMPGPVDKNEEEAYEMRQRYLAKQHIQSLDEESRQAAELKETQRIQEYHRRKESESEFSFNTGSSASTAPLPVPERQRTTRSNVLVPLP